VPKVSSAVLRWARETAGLSLDEAARRIDLSPTRNATAAERVAALESGADEPSRPLLLRMAKQYRRPLLTFYLSEPPETGNRGHDFRVLPQEHEAREEALLDALLRDVRSRQAIIRSALEEEEESEPLIFVGAAKLSNGVPETATMLQAMLSVTSREYRAQQGPDEAFRFLRSRAESIGVFVLLLGNLGNHHTALSLETFRGIAIADPFAPFVVINDQDSRAAWSFSLLHELCHILLGETGVSGGIPAPGVEEFCNSVAAEFLLPGRELRHFYNERKPSTDQLSAWISDLAGALNVSRTMVALRLLRNALISEDKWEALSRDFKAQWLQSRDRSRELAKEKDGGPTFYVVRRHRLGAGLLSTTKRLLRSGVLTTGKSARVLGVKPTQVGPMLGIEASQYESDA
jgi:Zn-dependent peptidase ImmA (M78 family)